MLMVPVVAAAIHFSIYSPAFESGGTMPAKYTCDGAGVSPPLRWIDPPPGTKSFRLYVTDPDVPSGLFVHWRATFPASARGINQGRHAPHEGYNGFHTRGWGAPCPPAGQPAHRYLFVLTALNGSGQPIGEADLVGRYSRG
jgi:Raf kinase inhibitor-like YbhB/YbcL family protein